MRAAPESRPQRTLLQLVEKLEATKPKAGLVDPITVGRSLFLFIYIYFLFGFCFGAHMRKTKNKNYYMKRKTRARARSGGDG